jgi:hypothetical protein
VVVGSPKFSFEEATLGAENNPSKTVRVINFIDTS